MQITNSWLYNLITIYILTHTYTHISVFCFSLELFILILLICLHELTEKIVKFHAKVFNPTPYKDTQVITANSLLPN